MHQPPNSPSCHRPGFRKRVDDEHRVVRLGNLKKRRCVQCVVINKCAINLIADDRDPVFAREVEPVRCSSRDHHPSRGIAGRRDEDRLCPRIASREQFLEIELPTRWRCVPFFFRPRKPDLCAGHLCRLKDVRPYRRHAHHVIACLSHALQCCDNRQHRCTGHGDALYRDIAFPRCGRESPGSPRATASHRAMPYRKRALLSSAAFAASRMKEGVTRSLSPRTTAE